MRHKKRMFFFCFLILAAVVFFVVSKRGKEKPATDTVEEINPVTGPIENLISTTGTVLPKNRLEIKPPVNGRIEEILVQEGGQVKAGQTLVWMSSTERAALLDAARGQGEETLAYWEGVYKPIALISPIDGEVIVATTQPGQTVTTSDAVVVLSDRLIVRAQVDETDIGKIRLNQDAVIVLDAYPDANIKATVVHIYYESETVNNVTIYNVDLLPENVPSFFRSGMNASVDFIANRKNNILLVPSDAVLRDGDTPYILVKTEKSSVPVRRDVTLGISDDKNVEVISGLSAFDTVVLKTQKYTLPKNSAAGTNPFMPKMPSHRQNSSASKQK